MKIIMKSVKIAFAVIVMSSMNFACNSSSQEAVAPMQTDVTEANVADASAAREGNLTAEVIFQRTTSPTPGTIWKASSFGNENKKNNFGGGLEDDLAYIDITHKNTSAKKTLYVKVFSDDNQKGEVQIISVPRGESKIYSINNRLTNKASSFSIYYSEN